MTETAERRYEERKKRVDDAVALRIPDRIPIVPTFGFFPAKYAGMTCEEVMYDLDKMWDAEWKVIKEFEPDMIRSPYGTRSIGPLLDALDFRQLQWPGRGVDPNVSYQFVEAEYMKAEEYDAFLSDPSDFIIRTYWPRIFGALEGLEKLPPLHGIISYAMGLGGLGAFALPEVVEALDALKKAANEIVRISPYRRRFAERVREEGFPMLFGASTQAPFDTLGDFLRGTKGLMLDMYRRPELVIKACEKLLPFMLEMAVSTARTSGNPRVFIPLHKGSDGFMSPEQFKRFYWPTLRELMLALIDEDLMPFPFFEGDCTSRLDIIADVPEAKACYKFESTDMKKAKEALGARVCLRGNVPLSLLTTGTPDDVRKYCKQLIDTVAKDGGFIMDASGALDDARPENVAAMFEFTREYGVY